MEDEDREFKARWDSRWTPKFYNPSIANVLQITVGHASGVALGANEFGSDVLLRDMTPARARLLARVCTEWADAREREAAESAVQAVTE